ncbi:hypothetical protein [Chitinimonas sp.]|uniref:hypothetical protein n=1 Tax=Chitinimonas sp. TaxID=1934313 RepID=UPI0035B1B93D
MQLARILLLALPLLGFAAEHPAQLAANERGLVERMAKAYAWRLIEPTSTDAKNEFSASSKRFEQQLAQLTESSKKDAELSDNFSLLNQQWSDFQALTKPTPTQAQAKQVLEASEEMAYIAQKGGQLLAAKLDAPTQASVLAESVATLAQRLAKNYLLQSAGLSVPFLAKDLAAARSEFEATSRQLKALPLNSASLKGQIDLLDSQWFFFQQALDALAANRQDLSLRRNVVTTSNRIYEVATELAVRYQRLTVAAR